ncbi:hypothetical protein [Vagococcus hydrophili]|uniref:DUF3021 domain-containing protein n=1 Tax=Vagococcus hydrophili TaxID=2714947 RepID=A0A6G8AR87_9ENTE|nr:hypothetical protein [Vagococcus hydrophili]QIL47507.1 hypothetical protein G7082_02640 [Vagococcus hydrophili]
MFKQLKQSFIQTTLGSTVWVTFLATLVFHKKMVPFNFFWHILAIGFLFGIIFGVFYPYLWQYATLKAGTNIAISTLVNVTFGCLAVYLFSPEMFSFIQPYLLLFVLLTFIGHLIAYYFYSKHETKKLANELNHLLS